MTCWCIHASILFSSTIAVCQLTLRTFNLFTSAESATIHSKVKRRYIGCIIYFNIIVIESSSGLLFAIAKIVLFFFIFLWCSTLSTFCIVELEIGGDEREVANLSHSHHHWSCSTRVKALFELLFAAWLWPKQRRRRGDLIQGAPPWRRNPSYRTKLNAQSQLQIVIIVICCNTCC